MRLLREKKIISGGISIIEVLIAVSVFTIIVSAAVFLFLDGFRASYYSLRHTKATFLAQEAIEAVNMIAAEDFDGVLEGVHGLVLSSGVWSFDGAEDVQDGYTRSVTITDVDVDTKDVVSQVVWNSSPARGSEVIVESRVYDWRQTQGDAEGFSVGLQNVSLSASSTSVENIELYTNASSSLVIDEMKVSWSGGGFLYDILVGTSTVYTVLPQEGVSSGEVIDIDDYTLESQSGTTTIGHINFSEPLEGSAIQVTYILTDGSTYHCYVSF